MTGGEEKKRGEGETASKLKDGGIDAYADNPRI